MNKAINDITTMSGRCLKMTFRNSETMVGNTITPLMFVLLFTYVFGSGATDMQAFIDAQVPSVFIAVLSTAAAYAAFSVNGDMQKGIIDRFRSMPLFQPSVLTGHVIASMVRCFMAIVVAIGVAFLVGFRPQAGAAEWVIILGIMFLVSLAITWLFIFIGLVADSPEGTSSYAMPVQFLPFLSGGFAAPEQLVLPLRVFFAHQPFTPMIEAVRGLTMGEMNSSDISIAIIWCVALTLIFYTLSVHVYRRKTG